MRWRFLAAACALAATCFAAKAQDSSEREIAHYREMISDPLSNPGFLAVDRGEQLWALARGSKNVSLESCEIGRASS